MDFRNLTFISAAAILSLFAGEALAQTAQPKAVKTGAKTWVVPRTADGKPDLQGVWANNNATPLERPLELAGRPYLTEQEVAALKRKSAELFDSGSSDAAFGDQVFTSVLANVKGTTAGFKSTDGGTGDYSSVWVPGREWDNRTSLITDPADGRLPAITEQAKAKRAAAAAARERAPAGPEDRGLGERCITFGTPRLQAAYNSLFQVVQSPKAVTIVSETIHDARTVPIDGGPHVPAAMQAWLGDPRGHWEGDTLVIDSTNFKPGVFMGISTEKLHLIERYTRASDDVLQWQITVDDPGAWSKPWSAMIPLRRSKEPMYEYACHEGNYGLQGILAGARADEKKQSR